MSFPGKVLVANRGEIAVRVIRACRELGVPTVAVFSDADRNALHVRWADEAVRLGPAPAAESYLHVGRLLDAARRLGVWAIHPGYGFLAENAEFADACREAGFTFVGPPPEAIAAMGDKVRARERMREAGVPVTPGSDGAVADADEALAAARAIGFPVMLKAAAGGGGKGIRVVRDEAELRAGFERARSEAEKSFADGTIYVEKFLERPRHVEIQVIADAHGAVVHLGERECSVQRRHQKLIEETPSPAVDEALRRRMGEAAVAAARAVSYVNAGTVEFLLDAAGEFHFLEMNTRLQVEHPITEEVLGVDLVREQLRVAAGRPLAIRQDEVGPRGHAIEARVCAEDPARDFLPAVGVVRQLDLPGGPGVRVEAGLYEGMEVGVHYDPLLAKVVVRADDREAAVRRMRRALSEFHVTGVRTNIGFLLAVLRDEEFLSGDYDTGFVERRAPQLVQPVDDVIGEEVVAELAAVIGHELRRRSSLSIGPGRRGAEPSAWRRAFLEEDA